MVNGFDSHILSGPYKVGDDEDDIIVIGNKVNITGVVKFPEKYTQNDKLYKNNTLYECVNNNSTFNKHLNLKRPIYEK